VAPPPMLQHVAPSTRCLSVADCSTSRVGNSSDLPKRKLLSLNRSVGCKLDGDNRHHGIKMHDLSVPEFLFKPASTLPQSPPRLKSRKRKRAISAFGGSSKAKKASKYIRTVSTTHMRHEIGKFTKETLLHEMNMEPWSVLEWPGINSLDGSKNGHTTKTNNDICKCTEPPSSSDCPLLDQNGFLQNAYREGWQYIFGPDRPTPVIVWKPMKDFCLGVDRIMRTQTSMDNSDNFVGTYTSNANMYKREALKSNSTVTSSQ